MIKIKIDVMKIDKDRLYKGEKGTYLNVVLIDTPKSKYGDYMVVQEISEAERKSGMKGNILGNGKVFGGKKEEFHRPANVTAKPSPAPANGGSSDDVPF